MNNKYIRMLITIISVSLVILILIYGASQSDYSNLKKNDANSGFGAGSEFKEKAARNAHSNHQVTIESDNMANLGDIVVNIAGNKKLITNISLAFEKKHKWKSDSEVEKEILGKGVILRNAVITNVSGQHISANNNKIKRIVKESLNKKLSDGEVVEVYFNTFIIQ